MKQPIEKSLSDKYLSIIKKHENPIWARQELNYLVYDVHQEEYSKLSIQDKRDIDHFMAALYRINGGE